MIFCITGKMAAGKNAVSSIFEKHGFISIDADKVVHGILSEKEFQEKVLATFSDIAAQKSINLINTDGTLNRRNLGALIFNDKKLLKLQENLVLPEVDRKLNEFINLNNGKNILLNATVLYKIPVMSRCSKVIFVTAPLITRFFRAKKRDGMKNLQILQRFWSQKNLFSKYKKSNADIVKVKNTGNLEDLEKIVAKLEESLKT